MTRVTGNFQITLPKRLADAYGICVSDEVELVACAQSIAIILARSIKPELSTQERLRLFDEASRRLQTRCSVTYRPDDDRGWTREELHARGRPR